MGFFGRKRTEDRTEQAIQQAENIAAGRGLTGKLMKGLMGSENAAKIGDSMASARNAQAAAALQAQGLPTIPATVILNRHGFLAAFQ